MAGDVKPAPWDFNLHSWSLQTPEEERVRKENILQKMLLFPNFSLIVCDVYADSMSIPNPNNSGHQYPHQSLSPCTYTEAYLLCSRLHRQQLLPFPAYLIPNIGISGPEPTQILNLYLKNLITGVREGVRFLNLDLKNLIIGEK